MSEGNTDGGTPSGQGRGKRNAKGRASRAQGGARPKNSGPTSSDVSKGANASTHNTSGKGTGKQRALQGQVRGTAAHSGQLGDMRGHAPSVGDETPRSQQPGHQASLSSIPGSLEHDPLIMTDNGEFSEFINFLGADGDMSELLG
jgi:hypothetical protein